MVDHLTMAFAGFVIAMVCADTFLTRDSIKRSSGKIIEGNKLMVWFMEKDWRAVLITAIAAGLTLFVTYWFIIAGVWYAAIAYCLVAIYLRGRVVIWNYRLNVRIME